MSTCEVIKSGGSNNKSFKLITCNLRLEWDTTHLSDLRGGNTSLTERTQTVSITFKSDDGTSSACLLSNKLSLHAEYFSTHWASFKLDCSMPFSFTE